ncbi:MAG TPA: DUF1461 domain-containing protein [Candidatus Nanoarchaeia archaeon]|nr:DUF1461 domain-containing protein [Candidatus Nanoarchaeia archaeon]
MNTAILQKLIILFFILLCVISTPLVSYRSILFLTPLSLQQQSVVNYVQSHEPFDTTSFSPSELSHLDDVYNVMLFFDIVLIVSLAALGALSYLLYKTSDFKPVLQWSGIAVIGSIVLLLLLTFLSFNWLFNVFHQLLFDSGTWLFPANSMLIQLFPLDFFISLTKRILTVTLILGATLILISRRI